jgi:hypothetical protein
MTGVAVDRIDIMQFAIALDHSEFFTQTTVEENSETLSGPSGGGGIGAGGGGGTAGMGITTGAQNPHAPGTPTSLQMGSMIAQRGRTWDSREGLGNDSFTRSMPVDFELPRLGIRAGRAIRDYFETREVYYGTYRFEFDITTKLQDKALVQEEAVSGLSVLEEVTKDVLNT